MPEARWKKRAAKKIASHKQGPIERKISQQTKRAVVAARKTPKQMKRLEEETKKAYRSVKQRSGFKGRSRG